MYDHVIVGAGSAGCLLAARLGAAGRRVLLVEAGPHDRKLWVRVPAAFSRLFGGRRDWDLRAEPEEAVDGRRLVLPRGRTLGGSSSLNAMIYARGHRLDYESWSRYAEDDRWAWPRVLDRFRRHEDHVDGPSEFHGAGGELRVERLRDPSELSAAFVAAALEAGLARNEDFNGARLEGAGAYQVTQRRGRRWSAADAFLRGGDRAALDVVTGARATRLVFDGRRVRGVELERHGRSEVVPADREVVISAGAFHSPHLLMLSGVGPAADLEAAGVAVRHDLPGVGRNLHDHPVVGLEVATRARTSLESAESAVSLARWLLRRRGPLTSNVAEAGGFLRSLADLAAPDLQLFFAPGVFRDHRLRPGESGFILGVALLTPQSRGEVRLRSADPLDAPVVRAGQLGVREDVERLVRGLQTCRRIANAEPLARRSRREILPGDEVRGAAGLRRWVHESAELLYHPVGTCRFGTDEEAVVDPDFRVRGLSGVRVVDASVMPVIPRGNTHAPTLLVAETAAEAMLA